MSGQAPPADFYDQAACGGRNARAFNAATPAEAKETCSGCPVRVECLWDALGSRATNGIWGGLTYPERRALPTLPADRSAALDVLRQHLAAEATPDPTPAPAARPKQPEPKAPTPKKEKPAGRKPEAVPAPREDVAELLRQGHTQRQIMADLKVSHRVVIATRKAYKIPYRKGQGFRYSPEQRAENERRTIELLRRGATCQQVMDEVGISPPTIVAIRRKAGLPTPDNKPGVPARSRAEALARNSEPHGDGHVRWTGSRAGRALQLNAVWTFALFPSLVFT
ncbi:WhiB family transcriptional regulator [Streptomyces sp. NPDC057257]|uniref:WhiB family transcriptional regulator n=1 Tax=Streptomyces sp. NPDC057257 TaxID=3346071 RepID=UPI003629C2AE